MRTEAGPDGGGDLRLFLGFLHGVDAQYLMDLVSIGPEAMQERLVDERGEIGSSSRRYGLGRRSGEAPGEDRERTKTLLFAG